MPYNGVASLPTGTRMNPSKPEEAEYYEVGMVIMVLTDTDTKRQSIFSSWGGGFPLGDVRLYHHDQAGYPFGYLKVTGILDTRDGSIQGELPNRKLTHRVAK